MQLASGCMWIWYVDSIPALVGFLQALRFPPTLKIGILPYLLIVRQSTLIHSRSQSAGYLILKTGNPTKWAHSIQVELSWVLAGPWHSALSVLSSFVSLIWFTDFHTFDGDQQNSCHTMGDKTRQEAGSWALSPALMVSELSWWRYFFKLIFQFDCR